MVYGFYHSEHMSAIFICYIKAVDSESFLISFCSNQSCRY